MSKVSVYNPLWIKLKTEGVLKVRLPAPPYGTTYDKDKLFRRFRKAISTRKELDRAYRMLHPEAKIFVTEKNYDTMEITLTMGLIPSRVSYLELQPQSPESIADDLAKFNADKG